MTYCNMDMEGQWPAHRAYARNIRARTGKFKSAIRFTSAKTMMLACNISIFRDNKE